METRQIVNVDSPILRLRKHVASGTFGGGLAGISADRKVGSGQYITLGGTSFNGEKNYGDLGPLRGYSPNFPMLRQRSWDLFLESDAAQIVFNKYNTWVIGKGLKLQCEPPKKIFEIEGVSIDIQKFCEEVEALFSIYTQSKMCHHSDMLNLVALQAEAHKNAKVGGDVLVILRYEGGEVKVQLVDAAHVVSPRHGSASWPEELPSGNTIIDGIELAPNGKHVAYYVRRPGTTGYTYETDRIEAVGKKSGITQAYLVYGSKYRIDDHRGMPLLSVMMETVKKLERYRDAAVGSAEERAKIVLQIIHKEFSTGENVFMKETVKSRGFSDMVPNAVPTDDYMNALADKIAATTGKSTWNMPNGGEMKTIESAGSELTFSDFYTTNLLLFCAAAEIPYEVAMSKYDSNYSASRAALKDWEHTLSVRRFEFSTQFLKPIFTFWFHVKTLIGKIVAPKYLEAVRTKNLYLIEAYLTCRFSGSQVPHIDPEKEVKAQRLRLGVAGAAIPLTTVEQATEELGGGDSDSNIAQFADELKDTISKGVKIPEPPPKAAPRPA